MPDIGVLICGHGSRDAAGTREVANLAAKVARRFPHWPLDHGFLEFAEPSLHEGLAKLQSQGVTTIVAAPNMLFEARHAKTDIPAVLDAFARDHARDGVSIIYGRALGFDPKMLRAAADRIEEAELAAGAHIGRSETLLMVAGRGTSDAESNAAIAKLSSLLCDGMKFGGGGTCYSGVAEPMTETALREAAKLGYRRIVVMPYFLFTGALVERVYAGVDAAAAHYPEIEFVQATYLNDHPLVIETLSERIIEAIERPRAQQSHRHDHDETCDEEWHNHAPAQGEANDEAFSLAPRRVAGGNP